MNAPTRAVLYRSLRLAVVALLIGYVLHSARLTTRQGWADLLDTFAGSNVAFLAASLAFTPLVHLQSTVKWYALTRAAGMSVPLRRLYYFFVVGRFYNLILPSNIGGDLIRIRMLGVASGRSADAAATVFVERLTGLITLVVFAFLATGVAAVDLEAVRLVYALVVAVSGLGAICWAILDERPVRWLAALAAGHTPIADKVLDSIVMFRRSIVAFRDMPSAIAVALGNSVIFYVMTVVNVWLAVRVFESGVGISTMLVAVPILMFLVNIPLSVGNVGVVEFAYTFVLGAFGVSPQAALSAALLMRVKMVLAAAGGGVVHALSGGRSPTAEVVRAAIPETPN